MGWREKITAGAIVLGVIVSLCGIIWWMSEKIGRLRAEMLRYQNNCVSLFEDVETYRVRDSLSAAKVGALELRIKEYKRYRGEDAAMIADLRLKNRDLQAISAAQSATIIDLSAQVRDTVYLRDSARVEALALHCGDAWYDFDGLLEGRTFTGRMRSRDSLLLVETVKYARFLGFLWKTKRVKDRQMDAVSKNPHTEIKGVELVTIKQ